jgi:hypothetical protein
MHRLCIQKNRPSDAEEDVTSDIGEETQEQTSKRRYGHINNTSNFFFLISYIHMYIHTSSTTQIVSLR